MLEALRMFVYKYLHDIRYISTNIYLLLEYLTSHCKEFWSSFTSYWKLQKYYKIENRIFKRKTMRLY